MSITPPCFHRSFRTLPLLLVLILASLPALAGPLFPNPVFPVGSNPYGLASADLDGDGNVDLVTANFSNPLQPPGSISLLFGRGDGTFADQIVVPTVGNPSKVIAANLNGDALPDLILFHEYQGLVTFLLNQGTGSFGPENPVGTSLAASFVEAGDFNGDGKVDVFVLGWSDPLGFAMQVLFGTGRGTFTEAAPVPAPGWQSIAVSDLNSDGKADVLLAPADTPDQIQAYLGNGDGTFQSPRTFSINGLAAVLFPVELNGDGHPDLVISTEIDLHSGPALVYYGAGDGTFTAGPIVGPNRLALGLVDGDFNGDGLRDFADAGYGDDSVVVHLGRNDGSFEAQPLFYAGVNSVRLVASDFNRDGKVDLAVLSNGGEAVFTFAGNADGTFGPPGIPALQNAVLAGATVGDFNGDGKIDLAAGRLDNNQVAVVLGQGNGTFGGEISFPAEREPVALANGEFDGDGTLDLAVVTRNWVDGVPPNPLPPGTLTILHGNGDGSFTPVASYSTPPDPNRVLTSDLNGDGLADVLVLRVWGDLSFFRGRGDGTFDPPVTIPGGDRTVDFSIADLNQDGKLDLALAQSGDFSNTYPYPHISGGVAVLFGNGDGTFQAQVLAASIYNPYSIASEDLNSDGVVDLVVADAGDFQPSLPGSAQVILGTGGGSFGAPTSWSAGIGPLDVKVGDFDRDGKKDLAVANVMGDESFLPGRGDGSFGPQTRYGLFGGPVFLAEEDLNSDGAPDLLVLSASGAFSFLSSPPTRTEVLDAAVTFPSRRSGGSATVTWRTDREIALKGFNVVLIDAAERRTQLNPSLLQCHECDSGSGSSYSFFVARPRSGLDVFIEVVYQDDRVEIFGPATVHRLAGSPGRNRKPPNPTDPPPPTPKPIIGEYPRPGGHPGR